jgi:hypothetical protein
MGFINVVEGDLVLTEEELWGYEKVALVTRVDSETCPARVFVLYDSQIWTTWEDEVELVYAAPRSI